MSNKNFPLFNFDTYNRSHILCKHNFYVTQARNRIFMQFSESIFEVEAKKKEQEHSEKLSKHFNPDIDDEASNCESAYFEGVSLWLALNKVKNTVLLALTAGMFHQFDKQLREKCINELGKWLDRKVITSMIWDISFSRLIEILEWIGMDIIDKSYYEKIDICRQIVNVYKHGDGHAHQTLSTAHPEYYRNSIPFSSSDYEELEITEAQFIEFSDAITAFWNNIPVNCMRSDIREKPKWINDEFRKHEKKTKKL